MHVSTDLSKRARVIAFNADSELPDGFSDYEDLANDTFKGQVCMRSSGNIYNLSLMASMIAAHGVESAEAWAQASADSTPWAAIMDAINDKL